MSSTDPVLFRLGLLNINFEDKKKVKKASQQILKGE